MRILIIDDDPDTQEYLLPVLQSAGYEVIPALSGPEALDRLMRSDPDLVILDIRLPHMDGWEICQRIRAISKIPILMVTAAAQDDQDIVRGLNLGADDYLLKPLRPDVLVARIQALLRRSLELGWHSRRQAYMDSYLTVDLHREQVFVQGQRVSLTALEYRLLGILVRNRGITVPVAEIVEYLWSEEIDDTTAQYVRSYIWRLRKAIEPDPSNPRYLVTEHGFGYRFEPNT
nr:response regulator transcription factor [Anaerolineae bacterium]